MARRIFASEEDVATYRPLTNLFGLTDLNVVGQDFVTERNKVILTCVPRWPVAVCPDCRQVSAKIHDYPRQRKIHDQPLGNQGTVLYFDSRRFWCNNCEGAFSEEIGDVVPDCTYTYRLAEIITDARRKQDVATLASLYGSTLLFRQPASVIVWIRLQVGGGHAHEGGGGKMGTPAGTAP